MLILNLGCGTRTSPHADVVNVDWSLNIRLRNSRLLRLAATPLLDSRRRSRLAAMRGRLLAHDLSRGIPFGDGSVDAVYHSHVLEHLDRPVARAFLAEMRRVLKPGGICRIVVPDLEGICRDYVRHLELCLQNPEESSNHERYIAEILEQSVRREAAAASGRSGIAARLEQLILGDARRRGETHQWMYDRISLPRILTDIGFGGVTLQTWQDSLIPNWRQVGLDENERGEEYKPGSLYVEARK